MEMPKASFDTWVRDARSLSCENGVLKIGVRNAYARDWLESRLTGTVNRLLVGIFNTNDIAVDFVVDESITLEEGGEEDKDEVLIENGPADEGDQIAIQETAATEYERIVRPDRVVSFPGYLLRHLEQKCIPADELSLYLGTRQSVYRNWTRSGEPPVMVQNISAWELLPFSNMSHRNLFRLINGRTEFAGGAIQKLNEQGPITGKKYLDYANRWRIAINPPLTRNDAAAIETILRAAVEDVSKPKKTHAVAASLADLVQRKPGEYLTVKPDDDALQAWPKTVMEIVGRVLELTATQLPEGVKYAAENLQNSLMAAFGTVIVTHFFFKTAHLLKMSHAKFWGIISVRKHMVYNHRTAEQYDYAILPNGYKTLAQWAGVNEDTARLWLDKDPVIRMYMTPISVSDAFEEWKRNGSMVLRVRIEEPQIWKAFGRMDEWEAIDAALNERKGSKRALVEIVGSDDETPEVNRKMSLDQPKDVTRPTEGRHSVNRKMALDQPKDGTQSTEARHSTSRKVALDLRKMALDQPKSGTPLKTLLEPLPSLYKSPKNSQKVNESPTTPDDNHGSVRETGTRPTPKRTGVGGSLAYWDFDFLCANIGIAAKKAILKANKKFGRTIAQTSEDIVSITLYANSPKGQGVKDPASLVVSNLIKHLNACTSPDFNKLAALGPVKLRDLFNADCARRDYDELGRKYSERKPPAGVLGDGSLEADIYMANFSQLERVSWNELYRCLWGSDD